MTEDDVRGRLRDLRNEPVPMDSLVRVRQAVAGSAATSAGWRWLTTPRKIFAAVGATVVLATLFVGFRPDDGVDQPAKKKVQPDIVTSNKAVAPRETTPQHVKPPVRVVRARANNARRTVSKTTGEGLVVRIETADPNVVILLLGD